MPEKKYPISANLARVLTSLSADVDAARARLGVGINTAAAALDIDPSKVLRIEDGQLVVETPDEA